ncbi:hypothetical protein DMENIID0001_087830 [Sergentomyia squamirostris]
MSNLLNSHQTTASFKPLNGQESTSTHSISPMSDSSMNNSHHTQGGNSNVLQSQQMAGTQSDFSSLNLFDILSDDDNGDNSDNAAGSNNLKRSLPPPIVMSYDEKRAHRIMNQLRDTFGNNVYFTNMSIGRKISCKSMKVYKKILEVFKQENIMYFSHDIKTFPPKKFIISGLDDFAEAVHEIKRELSEVYGLHPIESPKFLPKLKDLMKNVSL